METPIWGPLSKFRRARAASWSKSIATSTAAVPKFRPRHTPGLGFFSKGRIDTTEAPGADWSAWSLPYEASGAAITSPSPRQFLELKARLLSDDPHRAAELRSIRLNFVEPLASQLLGEIEPSVVGALGKEQELSLFIKPSFASQSAGFDEVQIRAPDNMVLEFRGLRLGREAQWDSAELAASAEVVATAPDSLWVRFKRGRRPVRSRSD